MTGAVFTRSNSPEAACAGKHGFDTYSLALQVGSRKSRRNDERLHAYHCAHCGKFHVGHPKKMTGKALPNWRKCGKAPRRRDMEQES